MPYGRTDDDQVTAWALAAEAGDRVAVAAFVRATQPSVWRFLAYLVNKDEAEDLAQETFLRAMKSLPRFAGRSSARTWLVKTDDGEITEAVSKITWTATGAEAAIGAGQFQEFEVSAGPLPKANQVVFKAVQTYSNGEVVRWIEEPAAGASEPEHPAPILKLTATQATDADKTADAPAAQQHADSSVKATWALVLAVIALLLGAGGLAFGLMSRRRS